MYYGLQRENPISLDEDLVFQGDMLKAGTLALPYFKTHVFSLG